MAISESSRLLYAANYVLERSSSAVGLSKRAAIALALVAVGDNLRLSRSGISQMTNQDLRKLLLQYRFSTESSVNKDASSAKSELLKHGYIEIRERVSAFSISPEGIRASARLSKVVGEVVSDLQLPIGYQKIVSELLSRPVLVAESKPSNSVTVVATEVTQELLDLLQTSPEAMTQLGPEKFEYLVADRLDRLGYQVQLTLPMSRKDGGIDLIAVPREARLGSFLLAGQVKHHRLLTTKTGVEAVRSLLSWQNREFRLGLLVTNTFFTQDAEWFAGLSQNRSFLRLRDFEDLRRWLIGNFEDPAEIRELPDVIELASGVVVPIPRPLIGKL